MKEIKLSKTLKWKFSYPHDELLYELEKSLKDQFGIDQFVDNLGDNGENDYWVMENTGSSRHERWEPLRKLSLDEYEYYLHLKKVIKWRTNQLKIAQNKYNQLWMELCDK